MMMSDNRGQSNTTGEWHPGESTSKSGQMIPPWNARDGDGRSLGTESAEMKRKRHWVMPGDPDEPREDPTLSTVFPIQPEMDRILLAEEIKREGVRDSVIVWKGKGIIVDGHNRVRICKELGIPYPVEEKEFADIDTARLWMIKNQLGRRNIPPFVKCEKVLEIEPIIRVEAVKRMLAGNGMTIFMQENRVSMNSFAAKFEHISYEDILAKAAEYPGRHRGGAFADALKELYTGVRVSDEYEEYAAAV